MRYGPTLPAIVGALVVAGALALHAPAARAATSPGRPDLAARLQPSDGVAPADAGALVRLDGRTIEIGESGVRVNGPSATTEQTIRVHGRLAYRRPTGELEGIDRALLYVVDDDPVPDLCVNEILGLDFTDQDGNFDFTVTWPSREPWCDQTPDPVLVWSWAGDGVREWHGVQLRTPTIVDFTGTDIDYGTVGPIASDDVRRAHHFNTTRRALRWFDAHGYPMPAPVFLPVVESVSWHRTWYSGPLVGSTADKYLAPADAWSDSKLGRLLAEQWLDQRGAYGPEDLCNGTCDGSDPRCDYCSWCPENALAGWQKGFAEWAAEAAMTDPTLGYALPAMNVDSYESLGDCGPTPMNPFTTPGVFAACLHDMSDTVDEDDPAYPAGRDAMGWGPEFALQIAAEDRPASVGEFFARFRERYPSACEQMWLTAANVGYDLDGLPPNAIAGLSSSTHTPGVASTNARVTISWTEPADDCFGSKQYSVRVASTAQAPDEVAELGDVSSWTSAPLAPGTWYVTLKVGDPSDNWRADHATFGPVVIASAVPANLANVPRAGWAAPVVPRATSDATLSGVAAPATLPGNSTGTYWNVSVQNTGGQSTGTGSGSWVQADGLGFYSPIDPPEYAVAVPTLAGGQAWQDVNLGPLYLRGGRHTFGAYCDFTGLVPETDENDNDWARQWTWTPYDLPANASTYRLAPPYRSGGWEGATGTLYYNCDGVRFTSSGWWNALSVYAAADDADYDARLHVASTGASDGFGANAGWSTRPAGYLDAVFVNRNQTGTGTTPWDVGVIQTRDFNYSSSYQAQHVTSVLQLVGDSLEVTLGAAEALAIREVYVPAGWHSAIVRRVSGQGPLHLTWLPASFVTGDLDDYAGSATDDGSGTSRLELNPASAGYNGFVIHRDPHDTDFAQPVTFTFQVIATPPDFRPYHPAGWADAIVPRPANDGTPGSVPAPTSLTGWATDTWLNWASINDSPVPAVSSVTHQVLRDGIALFNQILPSYAAGGTVLSNSPLPAFVPGGRHTISLRTDATDTVLEISETNNRGAVQYAWSPQAVVRGTTTGLPHPADPSGGWPDLPSGPYWPNSDGYRTPTFEPGATDGTWAAVAVVADAPGDVDVRLHEASDDPVTAFTTTLATSSLAGGLTDFVAIDLGYANAKTFDVGVTHAAGAAPFRMSVASSSSLGTQPTGPHGPFPLPAGDVIALHEMSLLGTPCRLRLVNLTPGVNLDLTLLPPEGVAFGPQDESPVARSAAGAAGEDEEITLVSPAGGSWCAAVTRAGNADLGAAASYRLDFIDLVGVPEGGAPFAVRALTASPNPFTPRTALAFDLARAGTVELEIFDLAGRRVRRLAHGHYAAGRHALAWDGRDDAGLEVPSGLYVVHFAGVGRHEVLKVARMR